MDSMQTRVSKEILPLLCIPFHFYLKHKNGHIGPLSRGAYLKDILSATTSIGEHSKPLTFSTHVTFNVFDVILSEQR